MNNLFILKSDSVLHIVYDGFLHKNNIFYIGIFSIGSSYCDENFYRVLSPNNSQLNGWLKNNFKVMHE